MVLAQQVKAIRKLTFDPAALMVDLLGSEANEKLRVRVIPQDEFLSRVVIENLLEEPLSVRLPKAVAAMHAVPKSEANPETRVRITEKENLEVEESSGTGQAVVGTFGSMTASASGFPHQSEEGNAFTIPARRSVMIVLHSACAEHGKRSPISRMTYQLKPLDNHVENKTLRKIVQAYDPDQTEPLVFQAVLWHLASGLSWEQLGQKTVKSAGQLHSYFTREQLSAARQLVEQSQVEEESSPSTP